MNLVINTEQYNNENIHFIKKSKYITAILYKTKIFTMDGVYIYFNMFNHFHFCKEHKYRCSCIYNLNKYIINKLIQIEKQILTKNLVPNKKPLYSISRQLTKYSNLLNLTAIDPLRYNVIIKICSIWENSTHYGLNTVFCNNSHLQ